MDGKLMLGSHMLLQGKAVAIQFDEAACLQILQCYEHIIIRMYLKKNMILLHIR